MKLLLLVPALLLLALLVPDVAHAASAGGGGLPWDTPLTTLKDDLTGPVAFAVALIAMVACGAALIFGGEINEFIAPHHLHGGHRRRLHRQP